MKNWKTTLFGGLSAVCLALAAIFPDLKELFGAFSAVFLALMALVAKDSNVTGGSVQQ
jgi:hypothetical protein